MRNGPIPNYIYRWTRGIVESAVLAYHPERQFQVGAHPYWDFYANEQDLLFRTESRVASLAEKLGPGVLISLLHFAQAFLNVLPVSRSQGNKIFCAISKGGLHPWIETRNGHYGLRKRVESPDKLDCVTPCVNLASSLSAVESGNSKKDIRREE
jgi:hypothetical protein